MTDKIPTLQAHCNSMAMQQQKALLRDLEQSYCKKPHKYIWRYFEMPVAKHLCREHSKPKLQSRCIFALCFIPLKINCFSVQTHGFEALLGVNKGISYRGIRQMQSRFVRAQQKTHRHSTQSCDSEEKRPAGSHGKSHESAT